MPKTVYRTAAGTEYPIDKVLAEARGKKTAAGNLNYHGVLCVEQSEVVQGLMAPRIYKVTLWTCLHPHTAKSQAAYCAALELYR